MINHFLKNNRSEVIWVLSILLLGLSLRLYLFSLHNVIDYDGGRITAINPAAVRPGTVLPDDIVSDSGVGAAIPAIDSCSVASGGALSPISENVVSAYKSS